MKILLGVVLAGTQKDYCIPKFVEQIEKVFVPAGIDVAFAVDSHNMGRYKQLGDNLSAALFTPAMNGSEWATEIVYYGKNALQSYALQEDYDALLWQGIDCFYSSRQEFEEFISGAERNNAQIYGALVAGRNRAEYPVCRRFKFELGMSHSHEQDELEPEVFSGLPIPVNGYIGSDATLVKRWILSRCTLDGYEHWHTRPNKDMPLGELGPEEYFMYEAITKFNSVPVCHTGIRPWHVHETGRAVKYPDQVCDINDITY